MLAFPQLTGPVAKLCVANIGTTPELPKGICGGAWLAGASDPKPTDAAQIRGLLRFYAGLAVDSRRLLWRRTGRCRQAQLLFPRLRAMSAPYICNKAVHKEIDNRLHRLMRNQGGARDGT